MKLVFATHNINKFREVKALMPPHIQLATLSDIGCFEDIPETSHTIEGNAQLKAYFVKTNFGYNCFADDTGLEVGALNGDPGVYSARYAGDGKDPKANMALLLENLQDKKDRAAQFKTAIALCLDEAEELFIGLCEGTITNKAKGNGGFGYDPVFLPKGYKQTFAEMDGEEKGKIGHRGKAIRALIDYLTNNQ